MVFIWWNFLFLGGGWLLLFYWGAVRKGQGKQCLGEIYNQFTTSHNNQTTTALAGRSTDLVHTTTRITHTTVYLTDMCFLHTSRYHTEIQIESPYISRHIIEIEICVKLHEIHSSCTCRLAPTIHPPPPSAASVNWEITPYKNNKLWRRNLNFWKIILNIKNTSKKIIQIESLNWAAEIHTKFFDIG